MQTQIITSDRDIRSKAREAINTLKRVMQQYKLVLLATSWGKDSSTIMGLALQAAKELKQDEGIAPNIIAITSDTGVENPSVIKLARKMSDRMLEFAANEGLQVQQRWVRPTTADHYLVQMIGGRSIASIPGQQGSCATDLKIRPMQSAQKEFAKVYGAENIVTVIGTRFDESVTRGARMMARGESATEVQITDTGSGLISPIANWSEGDVWAFLNGTKAISDLSTLDWTPTLALYESVGESTCSIGAADPSFTKSAGSCGNSRMGCWACQKVTEDRSLIGMTTTNPAYEPLTRLSRTIRAGHFVPENRSYLGRSIEADGSIKVFANTYSPTWTTKLLQWTLTIDAREDDYARENGKPRRFPRLLEVQQLLMIAFFWARYGQHTPGSFIRIYDSIAGGARFDLPTDNEIADMEARSDRSIAGKTFGYLEVGAPVTQQYQDGWREVLGSMASFDGEHAACSIPAMNASAYRSGKGINHAPIVNDAQLTINAEELGFTDSSGNPTIAFHDFMWWYRMEHGDRSQTNAEEVNWLFRNGIARAKRGYQAQLNRYQDYSAALAKTQLLGRTGDLNAIRSHPNFITRKAIADENTQSGPEAIQLALIA